MGFYRICQSNFYTFLVLARQKASVKTVVPTTKHFSFFEKILLLEVPSFRGHSHVVESREMLAGKTAKGAAKLEINLKKKTDSKSKRFSSYKAILWKKPVHSQPRGPSSNPIFELFWSKMKKTSDPLHKGICNVFLCRFSEAWDWVIDHSFRYWHAEL